MQLFDYKGVNHNRQRSKGRLEKKNSPQGWSSFWSLIIRPGRRWDNPVSSSFSVCVWMFVRNKHMYKHTWHTSEPLLMSLCFRVCVSVCASVHMQECVWSCVWAYAYMCVIMFTHLSLLLIYRCLTLCLSERSAKINVWGQASQICELSVSAVSRLTCVCVFCVQSHVCFWIRVSVCVSADVACLLGLIWGSTGEISGFCHPHICVYLRLWLW